MDILEYLNVIISPKSNNFIYNKLIRKITMERLLYALWILLMIYLIYRMFAKRTLKIQSFSKIDEVINSDKYKPKGQHDN